MQVGKWLVLLLTLGCAETQADVEFWNSLDESAAQDDVVEVDGQRGLLPDIALELIGPFVPGGAPGTVTVDSGVSTNTFRVVRGQFPGLTCPAAMAGACLDVDNAKIQFSAPGDGEGTATFVMSIPASVPVGAELCMQAMQNDFPPFSFSDVVCVTIEPPS